ncbi:MAG: hypothetical protein QGH62_06830, partial [Nitrospinaceae bacterium]|nr:hypothetical protein [Nitrospinaceae bacterium]
MKREAGKKVLKSSFYCPTAKVGLIEKSGNRSIVREAKNRQDLTKPHYLLYCNRLLGDIMFGILV